ncbi:hypothetical protein [Streptomyces sp. NPDC017529]|uniref:hypothetical protein n=1 Tax=Streptomyces sp. NPDC017529 TaxID=3365000 RepID=UPI00379159F3
MDHNFSALSPRDFEHLSQALAQAVLGPGVSVFGTLALDRLVGPATLDLKLGTLAEHYGCARRGPTTRRMRVWPCRFLDRPPHQDYKPYVPKAPCVYRNPGRFAPGGP